MERASHRFDRIRELTPEGGGYLNEVSHAHLQNITIDLDSNQDEQGLPYEEDWHQSFWGSNYPRLDKIKKEVDPHDVFWCTPCVGNENWVQRSDGRLCKAA